MFKKLLFVSLALFSISAFSYDVVNINDTSINNRSRLRITIVDSNAITKAERAATIKQVINDITKKTPVMVITVDLIPSANLYGTGALLAQGNYYADGCGNSGKQCNDVKLDIKSSII